MEHREAELRVTAPCDGSADDPARFLRELRRLRDRAGLGHADVAARAHYPCEVIRAAEAGPALPDLPVLSAYVQSCGGAVADWEERWRTLTSSPALPLLSVRTAGCSEAATAGARIGSVSMAADGHNPAVVMAALSRVVSGITAEPPSLSPTPSPASFASPVPTASVAPEVSAAWDAALPTPEPGSVFTPLDRTSTTAASPEPVIAPVPEADPVPSARSAPWGAAGSTPEATGRQAPPAVSPVSPVSPVSVSVPSHAAATSTRRTLPGKPLIAAIVIMACLIILLVALF